MEVLELLAMDYFIDALPDMDVRLRLREVGPKTISEAERIAVRLDAHKVADKHRGRHSVRAMVTDNAQTDRITELNDKVETILKELRRTKPDTRQNNGHHYSQNNSYNKHTAHSTQNKRGPNGSNGNHGSVKPNYQRQTNQGNLHLSSWRTDNRH